MENNKYTTSTRSHVWRPPLFTTECCFQHIKRFYKKILTENAAHNSEKKTLNILRPETCSVTKTSQKPLIQPNNTHKETPCFVLSQRSCHLLNDILRLDRRTWWQNSSWCWVSTQQSRPSLDPPVGTLSGGMGIVTAMR